MNRTLISQAVTQVGQQISLSGWVDTKRDHGKVTFVDLRDRTGTVQCVGYQKMGELSLESVIEIVGKVKDRPASMVNAKVATGTIEIEVESYTVLNVAQELPIPISGDGKDINEEMRLRYRYLDLRRERMRHILHLRSNYFDALRHELVTQEFTEVETPMLTKSTKEGARDFIVPSRLQPGKFYALPQSPQQYKQLLMTAGVENYFQFARCIRDEDLRADRGFEFTQLDLEMSFVRREDVMRTVENVVKAAVSKVSGKLQKTTFPIYDYADAIRQFGADKFDLRTPEEKQDGTLAFAWVINFPFFKKVDKEDMAEVRDGKSGWTFTHNPFSAPLPEHEEWLRKGERVGEILTTQYDLVCNGYEAGGGSIRAHQADLLTSTFKIMGYTPEQIQESVGHMLEAFRTGTPPHGGIALGLDRHIMILSGEDSLREVIPFPMTSSGKTAVMDAPSPVAEEQLSEVHLQLAGAKTSPHDYILDLLQQQGVGYQYLSHLPVTTSEEAAKVRGGSVHQGAKALVMHADKEFIMYVLPGDSRADLDKLQQFLGVKKLAMASTDSVFKRTGLKVGSIPPFGSSMDMKTYLDPGLSDNKEIAFNVGRHDRSVVMRYEDFVRVEKPTVVE